MSAIQSLGYVGLTVSDLDRWKLFATQLLGLQVVTREDGALDLRMDSYATRLRLTGGAADDIDSIGWEVRDRAELEALRATLVHHGIAVTAGTASEAQRRYVEGLIKFRDPEGLASEAYYGPLQRTNDPFSSPRGVRFKTGRGGLGHVVLVAHDIQAQEDFYREVLGFRVSDYIHTEVVPGKPLDLTFMRCNSRHHSLALARLPLKKKLQHLMLEVESVDDVGRAMYRCMDAGHHLSLTLGRHSNDQMLSFYPQSPSGFDIEYGWAGLEVDDDTWHVLSHDTNSAWGHRFQMPPRPPKPAGSSAAAAVDTPRS
ncbi:MAG: VOC family protein [Pseudomonadota bacterium]|nr:VOC family protein [Pseudomonadota bacterium]